MMEVDVAVVGGGPAGCSCATGLLAQGLSVGVLAAPNRKEKPTETANPQIKQLLLSIGADSALTACEPCFGICSNWGRKSLALKPSILDPFGHPWFVHRPRFDLCLQRIAQAAGAIWIDTKARAAEFDEHGVSLLTSGEIIRARWLVIATGSPSWPARITRQQPLILDSLIAFWTRLEAPLEARFLFTEPSDHGWWYICPEDGHGAIACFVTDALSARELIPSRLDNWNGLFREIQLSRQFKNDSSAKRVHVVPTGLGALPQRYGSRWIAVGDSAAKLDPVGSSGISTALDSGHRAALAVAGALQGNTAGLEQYDRWSSGLVGEFSRQRELHYKMESSKREAGFWGRRLRREA